MSEKRKYLNISEAAKLARVSTAKMYQLVKSEGFPAVRLGTRIIIPEDLLNEWLLNQIIAKT